MREILSDGPAASVGAPPRATVYEPSPAWREIYRSFFRHIQTGELWEPEIRAAAGRGQVIYVGRSLSWLDFLALDWLTKEHGLPLIRFTNDVGLSVLEPFGRGSSRLRLEAPVAEDVAFRGCIDEGHSALLFLRRPPDATSTGVDGARQGGEMEHDLLRLLVARQRHAERPFLLLPQTFVWTKRPANAKRTLLDVVFGPSEWPGRTRTLLQLLVNYKNATVRTGEPFDVKAFLAQKPELSDEAAADAIRYALLRRMERERVIAVGPTQKTATRIRDEILRSPRVREHLEEAAAEARRPIEEVESEARRELDKLCAAPDTNVVEVFHQVVDRVWNRIYDGLVVDEAGLERVRAAGRRGPLVFVPSHKSHVDYLLVSDVLYSRGMAPPLIAAGENLSFFPLGPVLRHAGAFFIRRSFKGRKLYPQLVDAYVRKILSEGWNVEVFIEGGRSRTGKLLPPKLGILSMIVDAALKLRGLKEISFVPISIGYERVIEEGSYTRESEGQDKEPESLQGLLRTPRVLRSKYGRVHLTFGEIFSFDDLYGSTRRLDAEDGAFAEALSAAEQRALVQRIAHRITYEINRVTMVTPASLAASALMSHRARGIARKDLMERARVLLAAFQRQGASVARTLVDRRGELRPDALDEALQLFVDGRLAVVANDKERARKGGPAFEPIYAVPGDRRVALEYHKNTVLHFFVASALVASALFALGGEAERRPLEQRVRELSRLLKLEFQFRADAEFSTIFADAMRGMLEAGELAAIGDSVRAAPGQGGRRAAMYAEMIRTYLEAYRWTLRSALDQPEGTLVTKKEFTRQLLVSGTRAWFAGEVELRESVSRHKFENAIQLFVERGVLAVEGEKLRVQRGSGTELLALLDEHLRRE
jgi:glycerol-3-phosphate O-acyltransferase